MPEDWQLELSKKIGLTPVYTPSHEDFVLLLLYLDGRTPLYGEEALHVILFLYPYVPLSSSPSIFLPFSPDLEKSLISLKDRGLIEEKTEFRGGRHVNTIRLTDRGVAEARKVFSEFSNSWILVHGFVLRKGSEVISELEALKKTYNDKSPLELLKVIASKVESEGDAFVKRLRLQSERHEKLVIGIAKQLARDLKVLTRESYFF
ncbi:hypothetical protein IG193_03535 [Infirmifilum lucidum]|uniref:Uncharacterized protein n=1 Tax=Infirmifilum lucidum TaxID=2776706 RepID=A0A7L9FJK9_9CREN|nr:hypothetical protein [Infirmifilum lucidum]QOJ79542.1 hypothetical protein IG193_03535 [Infirmifilum lucidum]